MNKSFKKTIAAVSMTAMLAAGFALPVSAATQVEVTGNPVMIRADAGLKNTVVSKAHKGDKYDYVGQKKDSTGRVWYNIKYSGNKTGWITSQFAKKTEDSAANPVKDYEGTYQYGRASLTVKATGKDSADITVEWANSASENTVWTFSGSFDTDTYRINYSKGVKTDYTYDSKGNVSSKKVVYKDGMGRVQFHSKTELVWRDEKELEKGEMTFTKVGATTPDNEQTVSGKKVQITATPVNVRSGASTNYKKIGKTSKGMSDRGSAPITRKSAKPPRARHTLVSPARRILPAKCGIRFSSPPRQKAGSPVSLPNWSLTVSSPPSQPSRYRSPAVR